MKRNDEPLIAIYDFALLPYALGDVLTWSCKNTVKAIENNKKTVDVYLCCDKNSCANHYQRNFINSDNCEYYFNELQDAFKANPLLENIYIYSNRDEMIKSIKDRIKDKLNIKILKKYTDTIFYKPAIIFLLLKKIKDLYDQTDRAKKVALQNKKKYAHEVNFFHTYIYFTFNKVEQKMKQYFINEIYLHKEINTFYKKNNYLPYLNSFEKYGEELTSTILEKIKNKKIVTVQFRSRKFDKVMDSSGVDERDADYVEWFNFLKLASIEFPNIIFALLGRVNEKPEELLDLPNVVSLRKEGLSLIYDLAIFKKSILFMGSSSGFASYANYSKIPYFITKMNENACKSYGIPLGSNSTQFASKNQVLFYGKESAEQLLFILREFLAKGTITAA